MQERNFAASTVPKICTADRLSCPSTSLVQSIRKRPQAQMRQISLRLRPGPKSHRCATSHSAPARRVAGKIYHIQCVRLSPALSSSRTMSITGACARHEALQIERIGHQLFFSVASNASSSAVARINGRPRADALPIGFKTRAFLDRAEPQAKADLRAQIHIGRRKRIAQQVARLRQGGFQRVHHRFKTAIANHPRPFRRHHDAQGPVEHRALERPGGEEQPAVIGATRRAGRRRAPAQPAGKHPPDR